ncbi:hypothetical protein MYCFIDRAFT_210300 [Lecanosticta acicola]|uniref:Uncharacterized protein n=1 Tax=Lecanosticta acicola TaxID=111012 RepID=A0AAI8YRX4_9PEZI|nr:hypothetical protein MYCFIDRAFT_210300 [Lecanosticta acicola]
MTSRLRLPTLLLTSLSIGLNLAILGTAARSLHVYNSQRTTNVYFLPVWSGHFDTRELSALIGTSAVIFLLNAVVLVSLFVTALPANALILLSTTLSTLLSLIALIFSSVLNTRHPADRATLQSWTCTWHSIPNQNVPRQYDTLCHETRFAFYTTIPSFLLQLLLLSLATTTLFSSRRQHSNIRLDEEKDHHELASRRPQSFDTKATEASLPESMRVVAPKQEFR